MNKIILIFIIVFYLSGCAIGPKGQAIRTAADKNQFKGLDRDSRFSVSLPATHKGPYKSIDELNFNIEEGIHKGKKGSAILGKSRVTGEWEVLVLMINEEGKWIKLQTSDQMHLSNKE